MSPHGLLIWGSHARHLMKRWCRDCGSPLLRHQRSFTPPVFVHVDLLSLVPESWVGPYCCMPREELTVTVGQGLSHAAERLSPKASSCWGPVTSSGSYMAGDPLSGRARPGFDGSLGHTREAGLPSVLIRDVIARGAPSGCSLGVSVSLLIALDPVMCRDLADSDFIVSSEYSGADLHRRIAKRLTRADGGSRAHKHGVSVSALLALVEDAKSLVGGIGPHAKYLFIRAEVVSSADPSHWGLPWRQRDSG